MLLKLETEMPLLGHSYEKGMIYMLLNSRFSVDLLM